MESRAERLTWAVPHTVEKIARRCRIGEREIVVSICDTLPALSPPEKHSEVQPMLYAILCYDSEEVVSSWSKEMDDEAMTKLAAVEAKLAGQKRLGPVARLMPTSAATTLRKGKESLVLDGPFAETKEQLLGFFIVDCASLEEALDAARDLARASSSNGCYEIRPMAVFRPGSLPT